jgi:hypothetical protein
MLGGIYDALRIFVSFDYNALGNIVCKNTHRFRLDMPICITIHLFRFDYMPDKTPSTCQAILSRVAQ